MDSRVKYINRVVREHDFELYAHRNANGVIIIYRRGKRFVPFMDDGATIYYSTQESPQFVCALTDNWKTNGKPRDWGADMVVNYIKDHDLWNREDFFKKMQEHNEKIDESRKRDFRNSAESFFSDARTLFKKDFSDVRTCNMDKTEKRKRTYEKGVNQKLKSIKEF